MNFISATALLVGALMLSAQDSMGNPIPDVQNEENKTTNDTEDSVALTVSVSNNKRIEDDIDGTKKKRECTLQAIEVIVSDEDGVLNSECRQVLKEMIRENAKKEDRIISDGDPDLRKELKELAQGRIETMNEIEQEPDTVPESQQLEAEDLKEIKAKEDDDQSLSAVESSLKNLHYNVMKDDYGNFDRNGESVQGEMSDRERELPGHYTDLRESKMFGETPVLQELDDGRYFVGDREIEAIGRPGSEKQAMSTEDFLVIPLRYLKQQLLEGESPKRRGEPVERAGVNSVPGEMQLTDEEDRAMRWALKSIFSDSSKSLTHQYKPNTDMDLLEEKETKEHDQSLASRNFSVEDNVDFDSTSLDDAVHSNVMGDEAIKLNGDKNENGFDAERNNENGPDVFSEVESDISKLGEDLKRLRFSQTI